MSESTDVEGIERATLAAVPPQRQETWNDWLLAYDDGTVGRCHSAVPIRHRPPRTDALHGIASRYDVAGRPLVFRLPEVPSFDAFRDELMGQGWVRATPTSVHLSEIPPDLAK